jgi:hypothetical protein
MKSSASKSTIRKLPWCREKKKTVQSLKLKICKNKKDSDGMREKREIDLVLSRCEGVNNFQGQKICGMEAEEMKAEF